MSKKLVVGISMGVNLAGFPKGISLRQDRCLAS
jgi:hypothetical protein